MLINHTCLTRGEGTKTESEHEFVYKSRTKNKNNIYDQSSELIFIFIGLDTLRSYRNNRDFQSENLKLNDEH